MPFHFQCKIELLMLLLSKREMRWLTFCIPRNFILGHFHLWPAEYLTHPILLLLLMLYFSGCICLSRCPVFCLF